VTTSAESNSAPVGGVEVDHGTDDLDRAGIVAGLSAYVLWGFITIYWKALADFSPIELIGYRVTLSALVLVLVALIRGTFTDLLRTLRTERLWGRIAIASMALSVNWTAYVAVVSAGHVVEAALGYFIAPLGTMTVGVLVLKERLRTSQKITIGLGAASVLVLTFSYGRVPVYALALAGSWTCYGYLKRRVPLRAADSLNAETLVMLIPAVVVMIVTAGAADSIPSTADASDWVLVSLVGVVTIIPLVLFARAARSIPMTVIGPMQYSVPVINFLLGWLAFDEELPPSRIVGFALVWVALVLMTFDTVRRARATNSVAIR
jgi:chloramphenicol-sensitive protein RarD